MLTTGNAWLLAAAPAVLLAIAAAGGAPPTTPPWRRAAALCARSISALLLTLALARPAVIRPADLPYLTVFAVDVSESVPVRAADSAASLLRSAWDAEIRRGNLCGLVVFAERAEVLAPPTRLPLQVEPWRLSPKSALRALRAAAEHGDRAASARIAELQKWTERLGTRATDTAGALRTSRGLFLEGTSNRVVLLTDGRDTARRVDEIDLRDVDAALRMTDPDFRDVAVAAVEAPLSVREGEPFDARVIVETAAPGEFSLSISMDDVAVPGGRRTFRAAAAGRHAAALENIPPPSSGHQGLRRLQVIAHAEADEEPRNNVGMAAFAVTGRPRVLLVEGAPAEGAPLARILRSQEIDLVLETPAGMAARGGALDEFVAVILVGVPANALPSDAVRALARYVESSGGGLLFACSASPGGAQGYPRSEIEKILPVTFRETPPGPGLPGKEATVAPTGGDFSRPPQKVLAPTVALLFIVDKSGSMAGSNIALVKEACIASAMTLTPKDVVGVLAFDAQPRWLLEFTEADRRDYIKDKLLRLLADGGTSIHPALEEALRAFMTDPRARRAGVKHAILMSDGDTRPGDFETATRRLREAGVTVTTVCVPGPKTDHHLMYQIASWGGGRFKFAPGFEHVPQIFTNETRHVIGGAPRAPDAPPALPPDAPGGGRDPSPPATLPVRIRDEHEILQGIERAALPPVRGILEAAAREGAAVPLAAGGDLPLLAVRRVGLGKSAAWTSDLAGRWSAEWLAWPSSGKLFAQLVRHISGAGPDADLASRIGVTYRGDRAIVRIAPAPDGGEIIASDPDEAPPLRRRTEPDGSAAVEVPLGGAGDIRRILLRRKDGKSFWIGVVRPYEGEFGPYDPECDIFAGCAAALPWGDLDAKLARPKKRAEARLELFPWLIAAAALLIPVDVGLRRFKS